MIFFVVVVWKPFSLLFSHLFLFLFPAWGDMLLLLLSCSVMSNSLPPHRLEHTRLPCPSPSPGICSNSSALSQFTIQPSHPLSLPSPPAFSLSQHQHLFQRVSSSHQVAKVLELQLQHQSLQWIFRIGFLLGLRDLISLQYKGLSRVFSNTTVPNNSLMFSLLYGPNVTSIHDTGKTIALTRQTCHQNSVSAF